ncbi:RRM domain-containing protein [Mycena chlorophos]|uniref:RRM domain-containing protein n=1 Tax=Mycena chlorophos TaxID=658473 RepID=A0A8H6S8B6_MYCCL|nr:RRM domain-containing protein [Mycena chlorophos]
MLAKALRPTRWRLPFFRRYLATQTAARRPPQTMSTLKSGGRYSQSGAVPVPYPTTHLYFGKYSYKPTISEWREVFERFGELERLYIPFSWNNRANRMKAQNHGFVSFRTQEAATAAHNASINGTITLGGSSMRLVTNYVAGQPDAGWPWKDAPDVQPTHTLALRVQNLLLPPDRISEALAEFGAHEIRLNGVVFVRFERAEDAKTVWERYRDEPLVVDGTAIQIRYAQDKNPKENSEVAGAEVVPDEVS